MTIAEFRDVTRVYTNGEYEMKVFMGPATYLISILITLGVSLAVSFMAARKNKNIDMVEALKGAE